jgi:polyhydroxybutyrate depolymerase
MTFKVRANFLGIVAVGLLSGVTSCGGNDGTNTVPFTPPSSANNGKGTGGKSGTGTGGSTGSGTSTGGSAGSGDATGTGGSGTGTGGAGASTPGAGGGSAAGGATGAGGAGTPDAGGGASDAPATEPNNPAGGWMGYPGVADLSQKKTTAGCGKPAGIELNSWVSFETMVPIPPNHDGPGGDGKRTYYVKLPTGYDPMKPYKVVIGGSSCVNQQSRPAPIDYSGVTAATGGVIQISPIVEPGVMQEGSYVCYDDKDTNSIEYGLMEKMIKEVGAKFCIDENKVFVQGHSSGGWYSNMMGCVYGGTLIRGMSSNGGGLVATPKETPPCKDTPTAGMWIHPTGDTEEPAATKRALDRALKVNKCEGGGPAGAWQTAPSEPFTMNGATNCKKYKCPDAFPVIFCQPPGGHGHVSWHAAAAWGFFNSLP